MHVCVCCVKARRGEGGEGQTDKNKSAANASQDCEIKPNE